MSTPGPTTIPKETRRFGRYELVSKLATGGMAEIFLARPASAAGTGNSEWVVIKRILSHLAEEPDFVTMFRDEAALAARLQHPNICKVFALGNQDGAWFIVMEHLRAVPLSKVMQSLARAKTPPDARIVAAIIIAACEGLHHAHELRDLDGKPLGVVHRDVSPPNMMITATGVVKILDFGIAKARSANSKTRTGTVKGKTAYMSPEQILGKPIDRTSDVFALGAIAYELCAIKRLFHRESDFLTFRAVTEDRIPLLSEFRKDLPKQLEAAIHKALARDVSSRFLTAHDFAVAVREAMANVGGVASLQELEHFVVANFGAELEVHDQLMVEADAPAAEDEPAVAGSVLGLDKAEVSAARPSATVLHLAPSTKPPPSPSPSVDGSQLPVADRTPVSEPRKVIPSAEAAFWKTPTSAARRPLPGLPPQSGEISRPGAGDSLEMDLAPSIASARPAALAAVPWVDVAKPRPPAPPSVPPPSSPVAIVEPVALSGIARAARPSDMVIDAPTLRTDPSQAAVLVRAPQVRAPSLSAEAASLQSGTKRVLVYAVVAIALGAVVFLVMTALRGSSASPTPVPPTTAAGAVDKVPVVTVDAGVSVDAGPAVGYWSVKSTQPMTIYVDGEKIGVAPLERFPLAPGVHKVKLVGPRGKAQRFDLPMVAGRDFDQGLVIWP